MRRDIFQSTVPNRQPIDPAVFFDRRSFIKTTAGIGLLGAAVSTSSGCGENPAPAPSGDRADSRLTPPIHRPEVFPAKRAPTPALPDGIETALTPRSVAASFNNFYEFLPGQGGDVWPLTGDFKVDPWQVEIVGECHKPQTLDLDALFKFDHEERLYHFRCVERWAMNVPWTGFPLRSLLDKVEPTSHAGFVRFISANRPKQLPGMKRSGAYPWPYHEGLRMDEAMHELTLVVTGIFGEPLLKQHGAPVRIIVPWKYGYKSPKSIVKIELLRAQPKTFWQIQPHEYGFLSNINPNIPHPRWSQSLSYWIDRQDESFPTPIFNGYGKYVADLYPEEPTTLQAPLRRGQTAR
ncbi:MAG: protein-methionine-sulfoxide reductase catalytic subunit MsrP [Planctomycetes bacterium]|nr:protein-methionine-sulfoxide reductase catalytic subunit MsrP [Planctomycetota bacterium]